MTSCAPSPTPHTDIADCKTMRRLTLVAAAAVLAFAGSASAGITGSKNITENTTVTVDEEITYGFDTLLAGIAAESPDVSITVADGKLLTIKDPGSNPDNSMLVGSYVGSAGSLKLAGSVTTNLSTSGAAHLFRFEGNATISGTVSGTATVGSNYAGAGVYLKAHENDPTVTFQGTQTSLTVKDADMGYGVNSDGNGSAILNFNADKTALVVDSSSVAGSEVQGVLASGSTVTFNGSTDITAKGVGMAQGVVLTDSDTAVTFAGNSTLIDVSSPGQAYGVEVSGSSNTVAFTGGQVQIKAASEASFAAAVQTYGGGTVTAAQDTALTLTVSSSQTAVGIDNVSYSGQFGTVSAAGDITISVEGNQAVGIRNSVTETVDTLGENDGVFLTGKTVINATATGPGGAAGGILASNAADRRESDPVTPAAETVVSNITISAVGKDGANALGIYGSDNALITVKGTSSISVKGATAIGIALTDSTLTVEGTLTVTAEKTSAEAGTAAAAASSGSAAVGMALYSGSTVNVADKASLTVDSVASTGTTNLGAGSKYTVTGADGVTSHLGTISGQKAEVALVSGTYMTGSLINAGGTLSLGDQNEENSALMVSTGGRVEAQTIINAGTIFLGSGSELSATGGYRASMVLGTIIGNDATVTVGEGRFGIMSLGGEGNTLRLTDLSKGTGVQFYNPVSGLTVAAAGTVNDQYASASEAAQAAIEAVTFTDETASLTDSTIVVEEGAVNNSLTATVGSDGTLIDVREIENNKLAGLGSLTMLGAFQWRHDMNDLTKRMGELRDSPQGIGTWARAYGSNQSYGGIEAKNTSIQVGADYDVGAGWKAGAAFTYTDGSSDIAGGSAESDAYGFAVYGTYLKDNGAFVDLIAKYSRLTTDFTIGEMSGSYDNNAWSVSVEAGHRFKLAEIAFVEPQVEVTYGSVIGDDFTASNGVSVSQDDFTSLIGRAGARAGFCFPDNKGTVYARASVLHDFDGETDTHASLGNARNTIRDDIGGTWVEYGVGANFNLTPATYGYVDLERTSGGGVRQQWRWNAGLRHVF